MKILDEYTDTEGRIWVYFTDAEHNGSINPYFIGITCSVCGNDYEQFTRIQNGIPAYYVGHPDTPDKAEKYFCSSECVHENYN